MAVLLGMSASALAADIYSPASGVVCDKKAGYCVDDEGISMGGRLNIWANRHTTNWIRHWGTGLILIWVNIP